jgi:signal recognition particle subunit SRP54
LILTRVDGDGRGGAALSMKQVTGQPIKFIGVGEKPDDFESFHPKRIASRILDMGDVVSLVERAAEAVNQDDAERMAAQMQSGKFDFNDLLKQFQTMKKMGGIGSLMGMLPGIGKIKQQLDNANIDEKIMLRQEAIIQSMTVKERAQPKLMNGSRKKRIAAGAGVTVQEVNKLIKARMQMEDMMKKMKRAGGQKGLMKMMKGMNPSSLPPELRNMLPK